MFTIVAVLFVGSVAHVAHAGGEGSLLTFTVENSATGLQELTAKLEPFFRSARGKPLVCMGAAEGSSLNGPLFEQLVLERDVRRFMYAQPKYLLEAKAASRLAEDPATLLNACEALLAPPKS